MPPLLQSKLLLNVFRQPFWQILVMHGENGLLAVEKQLEVRAFLSSECNALPGQPSLELGALHGTRVHTFAYYCNGGNSRSGPKGLSSVRGIQGPLLPPCGTSGTELDGKAVLPYTWL